MVPLAILLCILRVVGVKGAIFQAVAHLYVGGLFGAYFVSKTKAYLWVAVAMSALELTVAIWQRI